ncbi:MAG: hypothetical protein ABW321_32525 [Polyangiales bacterium]
MTKQVKTGVRSLGSCLLLLAACGGDDAASGMAPQSVGGNTAISPAPSGGASAGTAGVTAGLPAAGSAGRAAAGNSSAGSSAGVAGSTTSGSAGSSGVGAGPAAAGSTGAAGSSGSPVAGAAGAVAPAAGSGSAAGSSASAGAGAAGESGTTTKGSCLDGITNYEDEGPFQYKTDTQGQVKLWVPMVPAGCKVPVVHLANGTTANCGNYQKALERLASHGFLTTCYEDPNTGAGEYGITAFETALEMYPDLADHKLGSTGHSQGGQASLVTVQLAEEKWSDYVITGLAMEPASGFGTQPEGQSWQTSYGKIKSPVFLFSGDSATGYANSSLLGMSKGDGLVAITWVEEGYAALSKSVEAYHWTAVGATHIPTPEEPEQQISIPWFRWKLLGDKAACEFFKKMPDGGQWTKVAEQNAAECQ